MKNWLILIFIIFPIISKAQIIYVKDLIKIFELERDSIPVYLRSKSFIPLFSGNAVFEGKIRPSIIYGYNNEEERVYIYYSSSELKEIYKIDFVLLPKELIHPYKDQLNYLGDLKKSYLIEFIDGHNYEISIKKKK